jgi:hypothetical protein
MEYLLHGCPGIEYYQTVKKDIPIYEYLADEASPITPVAVDEAIPLDKSIRSGPSNITLEKYNTDADTSPTEDEHSRYYQYIQGSPVSRKRSMFSESRLQSKVHCSKHQSTPSRTDNRRSERTFDCILH